MKKSVLTLLFALFILSVSGQNRYWVSSATGFWNNTANWSATSGGAGGASVPTTGNLAVFDGASAKNGNCVLDISPTVAGLTFSAYSGTVDIFGNTLTTTSTNTFTTGTINNSVTTSGSLAFNNPATTTTFKGTTFGAPLTGTSGNLLFNGSVFNGAVTITKSNTGNDNGTGNNTFNSTLAITNTSTANLLLGNTNKDIFNKAVTVNINATGNVYLAASGATAHQFNDNIVINYNSTGNMFFGSNTGPSTLASGKTITVNTPGASGSGNLSLAYFTASSTAQSFALSGNTTAVLTIGPSSVFGGTLTASSPSILLTSSTFSGTTTLTKTGSNTDNCTGGNTFTSLTLNNSGSADINLANTNPDTFNGNTVVNNTGSSRVQIGVSAAGIIYNGNLTINHGGTSPNINTILCRNAGSTATLNGNLILNETNTDPTSAIIISLNGAITINGNITVSSTNGKGILFGGDQASSTGTTNLANGFTIMDGGAGTFTTGLLQLQNFTQTGSTAQAISLTGSSLLALSTATTFNGNVNFLAPGVLLNGSTFKGTATIEKNGSGDNAGNGGNTFQTTTTITNSGSGYLLTGNVNADQFKGTTTFNNTGSYRIYFGHNHGGQTTAFTGDVTLNANKTGGADGWSFFYGEGSNVSITFGGNVTINCGGSLQSNVRILNGTGSTATYTGTFTINSTNGNSSTQIFAGVNGSSTYNGNVQATNTTSADQIYFGLNAASTSSLASGKTITIGAAGFSLGNLYLTNFTTNGTTPQTLTTFSGTAALFLQTGNNFGGNVNFVSPQLFINGSTFSGTAYLEKNGASDNGSQGGNTFSSTATIVNSSSGYFSTANNNPDTFNGDLTLNNTGSNWIYLAHNVTGTVFNGNIIVNCTSGGGIVFSNNASGASSQASGKTISVGSSGFSTGELRIRRFTQNGTTAESLTLTGVAILRVGPGTTFGGTFNSVSPQLYMDGATFSSTASLEKNGASDNQGLGGNVFSSTCTLTDSGSGYLLSANTNPDTFNGDLTLINTGSNRIWLAWNCAGNQFNGNIIVNATSGLGIYFSDVTGSSSILASGKTISVGSQNFVSGELRLARFTQTGSGTPQSLTLGGTSSLRVGPLSTFNSNVNFVSPQLYLDGGTYNGTAYLEKNGASGNGGIGNNVFASTASIVNSGSNYLRTNGSNTFNGTTTLTSSGSSDILLENITGSTYNGDVTMTNTGSNYVRSSYAGTTAFNGNMTFNSTNGIGVYFGEGGGTSTMADTKKLLVGSTGFTTGELRLVNFTQVGTTAQTLAFTSSASLRAGSQSTFNANIDFRAPQLYFENATFNGTAYLEKNGAGGNTSNGSCVFASTTTIVNSGSNFLRSNGNNTFNGITTISNSGSNDILLELVAGDTYNSDLTINNTGTSMVRMSYQGATAFNGNLTVSSTSGGGIIFCEQSSATSVLASGKSIVTGSGGFTTGQLLLQRFTQLGTTAQTLTLTGSSSLLLGSSSTFNGNVNFKAPQIFLNGCTYNGITVIEKTGATNNDSAGSNIFNGVTTLTNSGSGWLRTARNAVDQFNNDLTLTNSGTAQIYMSDLVAGSAYNGNVTVNSTLGTGIYFGYNGGSSSLSANKAIAVGASGFTIGELRLQNFTQNGTTSQTVALTGTADMRLGPLSSFGGNVDFRAPQIFLDGASYSGTAYIEKNGAGNNQGLGNNTFASTTTIANTSSGQLRTNGNNTFNGMTTFNNSGSADFLFELVSGSTYNGNLTLNNSSSSYIRMSYLGASSYNGNITVNNLNSTGVYFGDGGGTSALSSGKIIAIGATGFTAGQLWLQRFTQTGSTAQTITLTSSGNFRSSTSNWNGALTVTSPSILLDGSTFNGTNLFVKNGTSTDASAGGNTFVGNATFTNSTSGNFRLAATNGDAFNGSLTLNQSAGTIAPAYAGASTASGDLVVNSSTPIVFGSGGGTFTFSGGSTETVSKTGTSSPTFIRLGINKSGGTVNLSTDILITTTTAFTAGVMNSTATNFINFANGSSATGASSASYVDGPVRKTGNTAFIFPVGNAGIFRTIAMSAPSSATDAFTGQYFKAAQPYGGASTFAPTLYTVSACEYWILNRTTGSSNVNVTLSWNSPDCTGTYITDLTALRVVRWNNTNWVDHGNGGTTGNTTTGTVITSAPVTSFSPFTIGSTTKANPLPIELVSFTAAAAGDDVQLEWLTASELNNDYFNVERSLDGIEFSSIATIAGAGTTSAETHYNYLDVNPGSVIHYYRLKQTDINGNATFTKYIKIVPGEVSLLVAWPNPVQTGKSVTLNYSGYYQVYSTTGLLMGKTGKTNTIDTSTLPAGIYILKADSGLFVRLVVN